MIDVGEDALVYVDIYAHLMINTVLDDVSPSVVDAHLMIVSWEMLTGKNELCTSDDRCSSEGFVFMHI